MTVEDTGANDTLTVFVKAKDLKKPIELNLQKSNSISEVLNTLEILPQVHHITSYDLYHKGALLNSEAAVSELLANDQQKTVELELKYRLYNEKSINEHLIKTRDIVGLTESESFGLNSGISKIGELDLEPIPEQPQPTAEDKEGKEETEKPAPSDEEKAKVSELLATFFDDIPQSFYSQQSITTPTVRALFLSSWNPVPFNYKSRGHLVYIALQTLEGETFHITGSTTGFFINKSSSAKFDPSPREVSNASFNLYDLIAKTSKNFVSQIKANNDQLNKVDPITFLKPQTTFLSNPWLTKASNPVADFGKTQFTESAGSKDFNDEFQAVRELPASDFQERIIRERLLARASYEFTTAAVKGAISVLNKSIVPLNPAEDERLHIFLKDGIFYSFGVDAAGSFAEKGGDEAARASTNQDLRAIKFFNLVDAKGIYTLLTTIVDYAGKRVVAQTPVPGLFASTETKEVVNEETGEVEQVEGDPLTTINYGRDDDASGAFKSNEEFVKALEPIRKALHYKKGKLGDSELVTSSEVKGMFGTDRRKYILDLYNSTPYDVEFIKSNYDPSSETSYPHKQTVIRSEAVQQWYSSKLKELIAEQAEKQGIDLTAIVKEGSELPEIKVDEESLYFSVDGSENDANVISLSKFVKETLIPNFIQVFDGVVNLTPLDGLNLTSVLHKHGINVRYLGEIVKVLDQYIEQETTKEEEALVKNKELNAKFEAKQKEKLAKLEAQYKAKLEAEQKGEKYEIPKEEEEETEEVNAEDVQTKSKIYSSLKTIVIQEAIVRAVKHILRKLSTGLPIELIPALVSHFHNVLLGSNYNASPEVQLENAEFYSSFDLSFTKLTPESVKELITKEVFIRYRFTLPSDWLDSIRPLRLLKEIALKFGIQWEHRDYYFSKEAEQEALKLQQQTSKSKKSKAKAVIKRSTTFEPSDVTLIPIIKDSITRASTGEQLYEAGKKAIYSEDEEQRKEGYTFLTEAVAVYEQTYGLIHPEVQRLYSSLCLIYQESGSNTEATLMGRKALSISERVFGLDSHEALISTLNLAFLEFTSGSIVNALKLYKRVLQISHSILDDQFINLGIINFNIVIQLQERGFYKEAAQFIPKLIDLTAKNVGEDSYTVGQLRFRYAYILALNERYNESLKEADLAVELLSKHASLYNPLAKQAKEVRDQVANYKLFQESKAKAEKEKLKLESQIPSKKSKAASKKKGPDLSDKSIDEVLNFVLGNSGSGKKKNKKSKK